MLTKVKNIILDTLFPIFCLACRKDNFWLCEECLKKIKVLDLQVCPVCERYITEKGESCPKCKPLSPLKSLIVAAKYQEDNISKLVHLYKYNFIQDLREPLGKLLVQAILKSQIDIPDFIIPVPLHRRRLRWRGFNQAELLADYVSANLTPGLVIPVLKNILIRKKYTSPQMKVKNYWERQKNIQAAFAIQDNTEIKNRRVLLIDDIATTGSTLFECAKVLKESGAKKIYAAVIARQEFSKEYKGNKNQEKIEHYDKFRK
ncbi:MAG: ComF family protein [Candidatus Moranbacteria bacterium]|nr:ComF family protein [Candidatus Moranbacteria bacterium]